MTRLVLSFLLASGLLLSCNNIFSEQGNGTIISEVRDVAAFSGLDVCCGVSVELRQADKQNVEVIADENVVKHVVTEVKGNTLHIRRDSYNINPTSLKVVVSFVSLTDIDASSGSAINCPDAVQFDQLTTDASSGSSVSLKITAAAITSDASSGSNIAIEGNAGKATFSASSGASIDAGGLQTDVANLQASSGASVSLLVKNQVNAQASSGGSVNVAGNPQARQVSESSGGSVSFN